MSSEEALLAAATRALERARRRLPAGAEAEVYACRARERGVELRLGRLEGVEDNSDEGLGLRVLSEGRMAFAHAAGLCEDAVEPLVDQVLAQLPHLVPEGSRALPERGRDEGPSLEGPDPVLFQGPLQEQVGRLEAMQDLALRSDQRVRRVLRAGYGESLGETAVVSTRGVSAFERSSSCGVGLAVSAEKEGQIQIGSGSASARFYADLAFDRAAREAAWRAGSLLDPRKLPTGRRAVVFDPWVAGEFLALVAGALSADEVQRGKSLFRGRLGQKVASPLVRLVDDPRRPRGLGSASFDDEGVPTRSKVLVDAGTLRELFYDTCTARKDGRDSNGSASRASYKGAPGPACSNFYLEPGKTSREALLSGTPDGVLALEVMGMHTADPVSGEFSVGLSGIAIEGGRLTHGVRGAMLSGNFLELLGRVDAVADDLAFYGAIAAPSFRVADMTVA